MRTSIILTSLIATPSHVQAETPPTSFVYGPDTTPLEKSYQEYNLANRPEDIPLDEVIEVTISGSSDGSTIVDGAHQWSGYQVMGSSVQLNNVKFIVENIAAFNNFSDTPDGVAKSMDGGSVFKLFNGGSIEFVGYDKDNRLQFNNGKATADGATAAGSAIWVEASGQIGDIYADFSNNIITPNPPTATTSYSRGGAISISRWTTAPEDSPLSIGNIYGHFTGNQAEYGGAIYIGPEAVVGDIGGSFTNNAAKVELGQSATGGAGGGALRLYLGSVGNISATFTGNYSHVTENGLGTSGASTSSGGAIAMHGSTFTDGNHGKFTGSFVDNIAFSQHAIGRGGAISLTEQSEGSKFSIIDADFIGNIAATNTANASNARGGAIYIENWFDLSVTAQSKDILISGNYEAWDATFVENEDGSVGVNTDNIKFNAFYALNSNITFNAEGAHTITLNDSITGVGSSNIIVNATSSAQYDVMINAEIINTDVDVQQGGLKLGTTTHQYTDKSKTVQEARVSAYLQNSSLNVGAAGTVNTRADYFADATTITNIGNIEFTGGTLARGINIGGELAGNLYIQGDTAIVGTSGNTLGTELNSERIYIDAHLSLNDLVTSHADTLIYRADTMHGLNGETQVTLNAESVFEFNTIEMHIGYAEYSHYYDLIISDGHGDIVVDGSYEIEFYLAGALLNKDQYITETLADGGLRVRFIPEPSSVTLSLLALTALIARRRRGMRA